MQRYGVGREGAQAGTAAGDDDDADGYNDDVQQGAAGVDVISYLSSFACTTTTNHSRLCSS